MAHDGEAQRALAGAVGSHQGMDFAAANPQVDPPQNRLSRHAYVQIADRQGFFHELLIELEFLMVEYSGLHVPRPPRSPW